jgi:uncharacterized protein with beta-barrel porin domain
LLVVSLGIGLLSGANSVLGQSQGLTYNSTGNGEWVGASANIVSQINNYSAYTGISIPAQYSGRRWDNPGRSEYFNVNQSTGSYDLQLSYPGSLNSNGYGPLDNAIIKHNITLSSPYTGYGENGSLNQLTIQSGGQLSIASFNLTAEGLVTNAGTLNISGSANIRGNKGVTNTGTLNISGSAQVSTTTMDNSGTLLLKNSNDKINVDTFNNTGTFAMQDGSVGNVSGHVNFNGNGKISVKGNNNILKGNQVHINTAAFNIEGTDVTKDFLTIDAKIDGSGAGKFNFKNVSVTLSDAFYNNNTLSTLEFTNSGIVTGNGKNTIDYIFSNGAGINPGNSPGTFTGQNFKFQNGSIIYAEIGSTQWDKLVATGNIDFTGNTKVVLLNYGNHEAQVNANNIIETAGKITVGGSDLAQSMVGDIANNNATISGGGSKVVVESAKSGNVDQLQIEEINVTNKTVSLKVSGSKTTAPPDPTDPSDPSDDQGSSVAGTSNLEVLGEVLLAMDSSNALYQAVAGYAGSDQDKLMAALSQLDPAIISVAATQSLDAVQKFVTAGHRRSFERLGDFYQRDLAGQIEALGATVLGQCDPCAPLCGRQNSRNLWFQALGGWQNQSTTGVEGYSADAFGFALGADKQITSNTLLGVSFGGHFSNAKSKSGNNSAKTDTILFSVYGGRRLGNLFINASAGYADGDLESKRASSLLGGWANSERDAKSYFGNVELAYRFGNKWSYLTPFISYDFIRYEEDAFTETGNIALNIAERNADAHFQMLGARLGRQVKRNGILLNPELTFGWLHDYGSGSLHTNGQFVSGGPAFTVVGVSRNKNRGVVGVKMDAELSKRTNAFIRYDGEFANHYNAQYLTGGINIAF